MGCVDSQKEIQHQYMQQEYTTRDFSLNYVKIIQKSYYYTIHDLINAYNSCNGKKCKKSI